MAISPIIEQRILGRTGLDVTRLGFGAMELRGPTVWAGRPISDAQAEEILNAVLDNGINFIDTSPDYGLSEERIGRFISSRRNEYFLATKCGCNPQDKGDVVETPHLWTRDNLLRNIGESLERMQTDHVDILQLHNPKPEEVAGEDLVAVLKEIKAQGMTRFIGISTTLPYLPDYAAGGEFDTFQIPYSCLQPEHRLAITAAAETDAGTIIRGGIARGGPESDVSPDKLKDVWEKAGLAELLDDDTTPAELILRYTLNHPNCDTIIVGTMNVEHLKENILAAAQGPLPSDIYGEITDRVAKLLGKEGAGLP